MKLGMQAVMKIAPCRIGSLQARLEMSGCGFGCGAVHGSNPP
jgi:hypothetical protein